MAVIRRHPRLIMAVSSATLMLLATVLLWPHSEARAQPAYTALTAVQYAEIALLRSAAGLDDDTLASVNPTSEQLVTILGGLRSWYEGHAAEWQAARSTVAAQRARVRYLEAALARGEGEAGLLGAARQQLAQLESAQRQQMTALRTTWLGALSPDALALAAHMSSADHLPMPFRILVLTNEQRDPLAAVRADYFQRLALTRNPATQAELSATQAATLTATLGPQNMQQLVALAEYRGAAAQRVVAALNVVLPFEQEEQG